MTDESPLWLQRQRPHYLTQHYCCLHSLRNLVLDDFQNLPSSHHRCERHIHHRNQQHLRCFAPTHCPHLSHWRCLWLQLCGRQRWESRWCALLSLNAIDSNNEDLWWPHQTTSNGITPPQFILFCVEGMQQSTNDVLSDKEGSGVHSAGRTDKMIE
jgi:hypothetical protein